MKRREFITLLGGAATWPIAGRAEQRDKMRRIGVLMNLGADDAEGQARLAAFLQGLQEVGWSVGRNMRVDLRWGAGDPELYRSYAAELVALAPDVILGAGAIVALALQRASRTRPIVFANTSDPVGSGLVASLARPGGNIIGFTNFEFSMAGKLLELLHEIAPGITKAAVLRDASNLSGAGEFGAVQAVAPSFGVELRPVDVRDPDQIESDIATFATDARGSADRNAKRARNRASQTDHRTCHSPPIAGNLSIRQLC